MSCAIIASTTGKWVRQCKLQTCEVNYTTMSNKPKSLFPSASAVKRISGQFEKTDNSGREAGGDIGGSHHGQDDIRDAGSVNLDWLTNPSFRSEDAIVIAKQHLRRTDSGGQGSFSENTSFRHGKPLESYPSEDFGADRSTESSSKLNVLQSSKTSGTSDSPFRVHHRRSKNHKHKRDYDTDASHRRKRHHDDRHHRDKRKKKHHKKARKRSEDDSSSDSSDGSDNHKDSTRISDEFMKNLASDIFCVDVKSDKNNLCFDSLHFTDTVAYHRLGQSCLGLDKNHQSVSWKDVKPKKKHRAESKGVRYFTAGPIEPEEGGTIDFGSVEIDQQRAHTVHDPVSYIPIDHPSKHPKPDFDPLGIYDQATQAYLGSKPSQNPSRPAEAQAVSTSESTITIHSAFTKTTAYYNKHLHENPQDIPKWLEFVRFQDTADHDKLISTGSSQPQQDGDANTKRSSRKRTARIIAEKKLAILDKALLKNPNSIPLQLEQLEISRELWDVPGQTKQWERLLKSHPDDVQLWREYLLFQQASFSTFSVSKVAGLYGKCFKALVSRLEELEGREASDLENHLLDLLVGLCHFWRQAGHTEKAVAAYQAMIELNCFCPPQFQQDTHLQGQIAFLETFWDSSEPRFGEKGAKGWASWMLRKERGGWEPVKLPGEDETTETSPNPDVNLPDQPLWQAWIHEEVSREGQHFAPWCPDEAKGETEEDCEDPERMVLFDDISQMLFRLSSQQKQVQLCLRFLEFLGISVPRCLVQSAGSVTDDRAHYLEQPSQILSPMKGCFTACKPSFTFSGVSGNCRSLEHISNNSDCTKKDMIRDCGTEDRALEEFVEEVFHQITPIFPQTVHTQLLLMRLDFGMQRAALTADKKQPKKKRLKEARRFAKKLLSQEENRNNLDLWAALASWEQSLGNTEEAKRVLQTALAFLGQPQTEAERQSATRLAQTFANLFVDFHLKLIGGENSDNMEVLHMLTTLAEGTAFSPLKDIPGQCVSSTRILKARRNFQELTTETLAAYPMEKNENQDSDATEWCQPSGSYVLHLTKCFAIFQYLTVGMQAASVVFDSSLSAIRRGSTTLSDSSSLQQLRLDQELLTVAHVKLLSAHVYSNPTPLGALRNLIKASLVDFPSDADLLEAFIYSETKSHIAGRVRRYFDRVTKRATGPTQWLFAVKAEMQRQEAVAAGAAVAVEGLAVQQNEVSCPETGISNRIRSLFERASESQHCRHCVLLWRMYMQFEVQQGNLKRAESIFYSALQHCPWAKVLYVDAVRYFPSKLRDCQDLLMEKELRIRAPLEEVELLLQA